MSRTPLFWAAYSRVYDLLWDNELTDAVATEVVSQIGPDRTVLEVGAGTGLLTKRLARAGVLVVASEPNEAMRARFRHRLVDVPLAVDAVGELVRRVGAPDVVIAANVVHLTPRPTETLSLLRALAGPAGRVIVVTPVPATTLLSVARAQRNRGASYWRVLRFVIIHALLSPLTAAAGMAATSSRLAAVPTCGATHASTVADSFLVLVFPGGETRSPPTTPPTSANSDMTSSCGPDILTAYSRGLSRSTSLRIGPRRCTG